MTMYKYKAISERGQVVTGTENAESEEEIVNILKNNRYYPIDVEPKVEIKDIDFFMPRVTKKDIAILCRQLSTMLGAGISVVNCLDILVKQTENKTLKKALSTVYQDVQKGQLLSASMKKHEKVFPILLTNMIEVGETSGNLDLLIERMASYFEEQLKIENKIKNALIYPTILSIVTLIVVIFLFSTVMPTFIEMFESSQIFLPLPTRLMLTFSKWFVNYWYVFLIAVILLILNIKYFSKTDRGILIVDSFKLKIPFIKNMTINIITSRFARVMSLLLSSGMPLLQSIDVAIKVIGNKIVEYKLKRVKEEVKKGKFLSEAVKDADIFHTMVNSMIEIGEESGTLDNLLYKIADYYDNEIEYTMEKLTVLIEPVLIIFTAIIIGFVMFSVIVPIFDSINSINL